jgi:hypothetical protein
MSWTSLNWSLRGWLDDDIYPSVELLEVGAFNTNEMTPVTISPPAPNSSYSLSFYGPSLQCNPANATQQPFFDYYSEALFNESIWTKSLWLSNLSGQTNGPSTFQAFLAFSAFSPGEISWYSYTPGFGMLLGLPSNSSKPQAIPDQHSNRLHIWEMHLLKSTLNTWMESKLYLKMWKTSSHYICRKLPDNLLAPTWESSRLSQTC